MKSRFARLSKKLFWIFLIVVVLAGAGGYGYYRWRQAQASVTQTSTLQTATVRQGDLVIRTSGTGTLISVTESDLVFSTSGKLENVLVKVGDKVEAGQLLAQLDDSSQQTALAQAKQDLLDNIQGVRFEGYERTIDLHIKNLRAKIKLLPRAPRYIETVYGVGYRFARE